MKLLARALPALALLLCAPPLRAAPGARCLLGGRASPERACADPRGRLRSALAALARSQTGRGLLAQVRDGAVKITLQKDASVFYSDADDEVVVDAKFLEEAEDWQAAVILAHELEHARQNKEGLADPAARGHRELGAFLVQCRVWIELGGLTRASDWAANGMNAQDMWAWLGRPWSAVAALSLRGGFSPFAADGSPAQAYWSRVLADESAWRERWALLYPRGHDSVRAALFVLKQALGAASRGRAGAPSAWLPEALEALSSAGAGGGVELPAEPSAADGSVVGSLPFKALPESERGVWRLVRL